MIHRLLTLAMLTAGLFAQSFSDYLRPALDWSLSLRNGYDSNVLRLSQREMENAATRPDLLGSMSTFDSYFYRVAGAVNANYRLPGRGNQTVRISLAPAMTNYLSNDDKKYTSGSLSLDYSWGPYRHLVFRISRLNNFHLRTYINRDIARIQRTSCNFSDADHTIGMSYPLARRIWLSFKAGYLQRYYQAPFTEFDLNIFHASFKFNSNRSRIISFGAELKGGYAENISVGQTARASAMDRAYRFYEFVLPLRLKRYVPLADIAGFTLRGEIRKYEVESVVDPLHSGRSHMDLKFDWWLQKQLGENFTVTFNMRHRTRTTESSHEWVEDLKSFSQIQSWINLTWKPESFWSF